MLDEEVVEEVLIVVPSEEAFPGGPILAEIVHALALETRGIFGTPPPWPAGVATTTAVWWNIHCYIPGDWPSV